jgi:methylmalonyl-CoA mutase C-terminal domain/subunit
VGWPRWRAFPRLADPIQDLNRQRARSPRNLRGVKQHVAARRRGVDQPHTSGLLHDKLDRFSLETLIQLLRNVDHRVEVRVINAGRQYCAFSASLASFCPRMSRPIRVLVAKPGLDGHDRGAKVVAAALRDAGMEVIYTGLHQTPEMIANAAVQEDVDVVGLSILSGAHMTLFPRVRNLLTEAGREDILVTGGGIIPREDMDALQAQGMGKLFGPGTSTGDLIAYIRDWFASRERQAT